MPPDITTVKQSLDHNKIQHTDKTGIVIKDSGQRETYETGANRDLSSGKGRYDLLPMRALARVAQLYEAGCLKYGDRNWEKGIPTHRFADSAMRHLCKYIKGDRDEDHLTAAVWNLLGLVDTLERIYEGHLPSTLSTLPDPKKPPFVPSVPLHP